MSALLLTELLHDLSGRDVALTGAAVAMATASVFLGQPPRRRMTLKERPTRAASRPVVRVLGVALVLTMVAWGVVVAGGPGRWAATTGVLLATSAWLVQVRRARRAVERRRVAVSQGCQALSGQLRAGAVPGRALQVVAEDFPVFEHPAATQRIGGDVAAALGAAASRPGCSGLGSLAAAWQLAERSGAPVAALVSRVAEEQRDDQRVRALVAGELAAPRATGKVLAGLPLVGVAMAAGVDADPAGFLLETLWGQLCVLAAAVLTCGGLVWTELIADSRHD